MPFRLPPSLGRIASRGSSDLWSPIDLPVLEGLWYSSDALRSISPTTPALPGDTVYRIPDVSGNGWHLDQPTGSRQPIAGHWDGMSGDRPTCITFDGINQIMRTSNRTPGLTVNRTIIMVCEVVAPSSVRAVAELGGNWDTPGDSWVLDPAAGIDLNLNQNGSAAVTNTSISRRATPAAQSAGGRGRILLTATYGAELSNLTLRVNNSPVSLPVAGVVGSMSEGPFPCRFSLMGRSGAAGNSAELLSTGKVAMAAVMSQRISSEDNARLYRYAQRKGWVL